MKYGSYLLLLAFVAQLSSVNCRYRGRGRGRSAYVHRLRSSRRFDRHGRKGPILPPPTSESSEDEARGLRGQANVLASLQKSQAKCSVEGSYGIHGECSKYTDCAKAGLIPTFRYCPSGKFFDHLQRICVKSSDAQCKDLCTEEGHMLADPVDTHAYLKCMKGVPMPQACEDEYVFNFDQQECVSESDEASEEDEDDEDGEEAVEDEEDADEESK